MPAESPTLRELLSRLEARFGGLRTSGEKPFSLHYRDNGNTVLIKVYRGIAPRQRQAREVEALTSAMAFGVQAPAIVDHGVHADLSWIAVEVVAGTPLTLDSAADVVRLAEAARSLTWQLHARPAANPGHGWSGPASPSASAFLAGQLSNRLRALPAWPRLHDRLLVLDALPVIHLHGDLKPEHVITGNRGMHLVDWEACARGPAVLDEVDIAFRVAREVAYADLPEGSVADVMTASLAHAAAMAWRLALWLDRRHDSGTEELTALFDDLAELATNGAPAQSAARIVNRARTAGTKY